MKLLLRSISLPLLLTLLLAVGAGCSRQARIKRLLARANSDFEAERFDRAEIEYLNVLKAAPRTPVALGRLGLMLAEQGRFPDASFFLNRGVELDPENIVLRAKLCVVQFYRGSFEEANHEARQVLKRQPGQEDAVFVLADYSAMTNRVPDFRKELEEMRLKSGDKPAYHLALAHLILREATNASAEAGTNAEREVTQALALDPKSSAAYDVLSKIYAARQDWPQAEQASRTAAELAPIRSPYRLNYADLKFRLGKAAEARKILEEVTQKAPDYLPAWNYLAKLAYEERKYDESAGYVQRVLAKDPMNYDAASLDATLKLIKGRNSEAVTELERLRTVYSGVKEVQYELALAYLATGDTAKAIGCLDQALRINPDYSPAILLLSRVNLQQRNLDAVITALTRLVNRQPQIAEAHLILAEAYLAKSNPQEALAIYQRMLVMFPKSHEVPYLMATILDGQSKWQEQQGQTQEALGSRQAARKACEQSLSLNQDFLPSLGLLVDLDLAEAQAQAALARVQKEIARRPTNAELLVLLARIYKAQNNLQQAESTLLKAIELAPDLYTPYQQLAAIYVKEKQPQKALEKLKSFPARTNDAAALVDMAVIQDQELNDYSAARDSYEKVLAINPRSFPVLNTLAYLYAERLGQFDKALSLAQRARELYPTELGAADTLGWILFRKPQPDLQKALVLLEEAAAKLPKLPEVQFHVGMARYAAGQESAAQVALELADHATNNFPGKEQAKARLEILAMDPQKTNSGDKPTLERRLREAPGDIVAGIRLAAIYDREEAWDKAATVYEQVLQGDPKNPAILKRLSGLYAGPLKNPQKALDYAKDAHAAAPEDAAISQRLGHLVLQNGDFKWANSLLQEAARKTNAEPALLYDLAWSCYGVGRVSEAESSMQQVVSAGSQLDRSDDAHLFLAMTAAYRDPSLRPSAASQLAQVLSTNAGYIPGIMLSAALSQEKGNLQQAKQAFQKVVALNPLFAPAVRDLTLLCSLHFANEPGIYDLAIQARQAFPTDPALAKALGIMSFRREDFSRAGQLLTEATQVLKDDGEALCYLGLSLHRLKQDRESRSVLTRALSSKSDPGLIQLANQALAEMTNTTSKP